METQTIEVRMNSFPLTPFLVSLQADGIKPTIYDYERIACLLRIQGPWTIKQLRDSLSALLVQDEDQEQIFIQRFNNFFDIKVDNIYENINVDLALSDLQNLSLGKIVPHQKESTIRKSETLIRPSQKPRRRLIWLFVLAILLTIGSFALFQLPDTKPGLYSKTSNLNFANQLLDSLKIRKLTLINNQVESITIDTLFISGEFSDDFDLISNNFINRIEANDSISIYVGFKPSWTGKRTAFMEVLSNHLSLDLSIPLIGVGVKAETKRKPAINRRKRLYRNAPIAVIEYEPITRLNDWEYFIDSATFFLLIITFYGTYLWRSKKVPNDMAIPFNKQGPRHFRHGIIGGTTITRLSEGVLNELGDSMGYFKSGLIGTRLNIPASIRATSQNGGVPTLEYFNLKRIRSLLILEDAFAEPTYWKPIAKELAQGMKKRGLPVIFGKFRGSPNKFSTSDGVIHLLEDFEDNRRGHLLLIFTDGKGIDRHSGAFVLEALSKWPMVAWMELREPQYWDETSILPTIYNIPIYPSNYEGLIRAFNRFLSEVGHQQDYSSTAINWEIGFDLAHMDLRNYVEYSLGDTFLWAQDCALMQPISLGLVEGLRAKFYSHLPPDGMEKFLHLPGTSLTGSGMRFSHDVLIILKNGFLNRKGSNEQEKILNFIVEQIEEVEPNQKGSLQHMAWEAVRSRLLLESDPDMHLEKLAQLSKGPLNGFIESSLEGHGFVGNKDKIPLRIKPSSRDALQRLGQLNKKMNIRKFEAYPIAWGHWPILLVMLSVIFINGGIGIKKYLNANQVTNNFEINGSVNTYFNLQEENKKASPQNRFGRTGPPIQLALEENKRYTLHLYGSGIKTSTKLNISDSLLQRVSVKNARTEIPCRKEFPEIGLLVQYCPEEENKSDLIEISSWQEKVGRINSGNTMMSIGLEIFPTDNYHPSLWKLHNMLLKSSSVDVIYSVHPDTRGIWHIDEALEHIKTELKPLLRRSQIIWWGEPELKNSIIISDKLSSFERVLKLGGGQDLSWIAEIEQLLMNDTSALLTEKEILTKLKDARSDGEGDEIRLARLVSNIGTLLLEIDPPWAEITLVSSEGLTKVARADEQLELPTGNWQIIASAIGHKKVEQAMVLNLGEQKSVKINLPKKLEMIQIGSSNPGVLTSKNENERTSIADSLNILASTYLAENEFIKAANIYQRILDLLKNSSLGPLYATALYNLGKTSLRIGKYDEAEQYLEKALIIQDSLLGEYHPDQINSLNSLGVLNSDLGRLDKALTLFKESLRKSIAVFGEENDKTANMYANIGVVYIHMNDLIAASENFKKSLLIYDKESLNASRLYGNLGIVYRKMDDFGMALENYNKSLSINIKLLGESHRDVSRIYGRLGSVYKDMGDFGKALENYQKSLSITEKLNDVPSILVISTYEGLGSIYKDMGDFGKALENYQKSLQISQEYWGAYHPRYYSIYEGLGTVYQEIGKLDQATVYYEKTLKTIKQHSIENDSAELRVLNVLTNIYEQTGETNKANSLRERIRNLRKIDGEKN